MIYSSLELYDFSNRNTFSMHALNHFINDTALEFVFFIFEIWMPSENCIPKKFDFHALHSVLFYQTHSDPNLDNENYFSFEMK